MLCHGNNLAKGHTVNGVACVVTCVTLLCAGTACAAERRKELTPAAPIKGYPLVWSDEFDGKTLDKKKWDYRLLGPRRSAINVKEAVTLDGKGHLVLTTSHNSNKRKKDNKYNTGMIGTEGKFETTYGYFECRVKLQKQEGHWSAFWLQSPTIGKWQDDTARSGTEIDIYEYSSHLKDKVLNTLHWNGYKKGHKAKGHRPRAVKVPQEWHTFGLLWTDKSYTWYVDGKETWKTSKAFSKGSEYIILSLEVQDVKWAGNRDCSEDAWLARLSRGPQWRG